MSIGIELSNKDLEAVSQLYRVRWTAEISNWKERNTDYCMWFVRCPDKEGNFITETGQSLSETIYNLLKKVS